MTNNCSALDHGSIADGADLPRPETTPLLSDHAGAKRAMPRPLPNVKDNGRISFGAGFRLLSK
jgi:hypothetical protein